MKPALIDTNILSLFFRGQVEVIRHFQAYLEIYETINLSIITYYEIVSGLRHRGATKQLAMFSDFAAQNTILPLTPAAADLAAESYAVLRQRGEPVDDIDLLIAGTAMGNGLILITHNRQHFDRIPGLSVEDWAAV